ncbi:MAG: LacI family DNA-binding transcriptional regulator [Anaerolineae bacterium]
MPTIVDVARRAGVSPTTVSHVINQTRYVSPSVAERVRQAMAELRYQPHGVARSLRRRRTHSLGMIIPDASSPFFAEVARGAETCAFSLGYTVILCNSDGDLVKEQAYIDVLIEKRVDGIVFVAAGESHEHIMGLLDQEIQVVVVDREMAGLTVDRVLVDNYNGGRQAVEHLIHHGHRRIACLAGPHELAPSAERVRGYRQALADAHIRFDPQLLVYGDFHTDSGYIAAAELLELPDRPTAIFACNDLMAIGVMAAVQEAGLRIPRNMAVVGFDDIALASYSIPRLTTVAQPSQKMGELSAQLLVARIENPNRAPERHLLPTRLVVRESA